MVSAKIGQTERFILHFSIRKRHMVNRKTGSSDKSPFSNARTPKCSYTNAVLRETDYSRKFRGRFFGKDGYPKYLRHVMKNSSERELEKQKIKDNEFLSLLRVCYKNLKLIYSMYKDDFDEKLADVLIQRKDDNGYFFERICIYLEREEFTDMIYDVRSILSSEYDLLNIRQNINRKGYSEYRKELEGQINADLLLIFEKTINFLDNINILYDSYSRAFADETFELREELIRRLDEYLREIDPASIVMVLRKIVAHSYELLYFIDVLYEFELKEEMEEIENKS